jgi:hypothetical protein|tara:strand:- start:198 stop:410 length:213 start_codon:yes stop_codon:yes gene_type:complete
MNNIKYELQSKTKGFDWKVFDIYSDIADPDIKMYASRLINLEHTSAVRLFKVEVVRTEMRPNGKGEFVPI